MLQLMSALQRNVMQMARPPSPDTTLSTNCSSQQGPMTRASHPAQISFYRDQDHRTSQPTTILEIKVCRDTTPQDQLNRAEAQHARLQGGLGAKLTTILIGASGTIYKGHTIQALEQLGVSTRDAKKCAAKLHLAAVRSLYEIIRLRRLLESGMPVGSGRSGRLSAS